MSKNGDISQKKHMQQKWMKLDNAAKIYPAAMTSEWMSIFRLSVDMKEPIDPTVLESALVRTIKRFPSLSLCLKRGVFWYYLEHIEVPPRIEKDVLNPCVRMNFKKNNGYMFRVRYYETKLAVEFFHVLTDGNGGMCFLKTLVAEYIEEKYGEKVPRSDTILDCSEKADISELEDNYLKYARAQKVSRDNSSSYHLVGEPEPRDLMHITTAFISVDEISAKAKSYGVTISEYLTANIIMAIRDIQRNDASRRKRLKPVKICVPVNLRKFYDSNTMRNFSAFVNVGITPELGEYSFEETLKIVKHQIGLQATEKQLNAWISSNVSSERNKLIRVIPLFIKNPIMKLVFKLNGDRTSTTTMSNLGNTVLPEEMSKYIERFDFMIGSLSKNPVVCACVSYNGVMTFNITRKIKEPVFERNLLTRFVKQGIHVKVESNQLS